MPTPTTHLPTFGRIFRAGLSWPRRIFRAIWHWRIIRAIFRWRTARRVLLGGAILATLMVGFYLEELWRGERAWDAARRDFEAQGGTLDLLKLAPPPVPDDQNFAMTPLLKPLYPEGTHEHPNNYPAELAKKLAWPTADVEQPIMVTWQVGKRIDLDDWQKFLGQTDILQALQKLDPELNEISLASRRPFSLFPYEYDQGVNSLISYIGELIRLTRIYEIRALAELAAGQTDRAAEDTVTIFQLAYFMTNDPVLLGQLSSLTMVQDGLQVLWEGLDAHRWSEAQLIGFMGELQKFDYLAGEQLSLRGGIAQHDQLMAQALTDPTRLDGEFHMLQELGRDNHQDMEDRLRGWLRLREDQLYPRGWLYQNRVVHLQDLQMILATLDVPRHRLDAEKSKALETQLAKDGTGWAGFSRIIAFSQASLDEAQAACALERCRLVNGQLPETLAELAPKFIAKLPTDIISGGPLHYQKKADGHFLLYEVGWNGTDDGGVAVVKESTGEIDQEKGDWVWPDAMQP